MQLDSSILGMNISTPIITVIASASIQLSATAAYEIIEVPATSSALLWSNYTFGDCCDVDSITVNPTTLNVHTCSTIGGYCSGGKDIAMWTFELPEIPEGAEFVMASFAGRITNYGGAGTLKTKWSDSGTISLSSGLNAWNYPSHSQSVSWPSGQFSMPLNIDYSDTGWGYDYLFIGGWRSESMTFYNSGSLAPVLRILIDVPEETCNEDLNSDGNINVADVLQLLAAWGQCSPKDIDCDADLDGDSYVGVTDLLMIIEAWGACE